jgi:hypothetical protein
MPELFFFLWSLPQHFTSSVVFFFTEWHPVTISTSFTNDDSPSSSAVSCNVSSGLGQRIQHHLADKLVASSFGTSIIRTNKLATVQTNSEWPSSYTWYLWFPIAP